MPDPIIAELDALHARAIGTWKVADSPLGRIILDETCGMMVAQSVSSSDAAYIAAAHNRWPEVRALIEQQAEKLAEWDAWLVEHDAKDEARHQEVKHQLEQRMRDAHAELERRAEDVRTLLDAAIEEEPDWFKCLLCDGQDEVGGAQFIHYQHCPIPDIQKRYGQEEQP